jgi:hypothetical protein
VVSGGEKTRGNIRVYTSSRKDISCTTMCVCVCVCVCTRTMYISRLTREKNAFRGGKTVRSLSAAARGTSANSRTLQRGKSRKKTKNKKRANIVYDIYMRAVYPDEGVRAGRVPTSF